MSVTDSQRKVEQLFRQYGRGVGSYVLARVGNVDLAENITSKIFLTVVRRIDQCRSSPAAWLWSIVRSEIARHFRDDRPMGDIPLTYPDPGPTPPELATSKEMQDRIQQALRQLDEDQHRLVYMKFFLDLSNVQIAEELGLTPSNIGVSVHRAVKQLRTLMESEPGPERSRSTNYVS